MVSPQFFKIAQIGSQIPPDFQTVFWGKSIDTR